MVSKKYVWIQSDVAITVTAGLQYQNNTDVNSHSENKLKVSPLWTKRTVDIKAGRNTYPSEIVEWDSVKRLEKVGVLTIGSFTDESNDPNGEQVKAKLANNTAEVPVNKTEKISKKLSDIAD